jgi:hypothetical protein
MAMAAKMPMMATTIINSMSVKPFWTCLSMDNSWNENHKNRLFRTTARAGDGNEASRVPNDVRGG